MELLIVLEASCLIVMEDPFPKVDCPIGQLERPLGLVNAGVLHRRRHIDGFVGHCQRGTDVVMLNARPSSIACHRYSHPWCSAIYCDQYRSTPVQRSCDRLAGEATLGPKNAFETT